VDKEKAKTASNLFSAAYFEGKYPSRLANVIIWGKCSTGISLPRAASVELVKPAVSVAVLMAVGFQL